jgi:hypothetical protein
MPDRISDELLAKLAELFDTGDEKTLVLVSDSDSAAVSTAFRELQALRALAPAAPAADVRAASILAGWLWQMHLIGDTPDSLQIQDALVNAGLIERRDEQTWLTPLGRRLVEWADTTETTDD